MSGVAAELGTLTASDGVLDGKRMQSQLVRHELQLCHIGSTQIYPDQGGHVLQVLGHPAQGETLVVKDPVAMAAGLHRLLGIQVELIADRADTRRVRSASRQV